MGLLSWLASLFAAPQGKRATPHVPPTHGEEQGIDYYRPLSEFQSHAVTADAVILDTETVDSEIGTQIIEVGAVLLRNGAPIYEYSQLLSPIGELPLSATLFSDITKADVLTQPSAVQIIPTFAHSMRPLTIIGHNIAYDIAAINHELDRIRYPRLKALHTIDTQHLGSEMFPNAPSMTLLELSRLLGVSDAEEHRALADARQTLECWQRLTDMSGPVTLSRHEQEEARLRSLVERRRRESLFYKSAYLEGRDTTPANTRPEGPVIETVACGVEIYGDEHHQDILSDYGYNAWLWVYVTEDLIRKGKYLGYPTYWVYLDGEEIGHISKYQMERHCGQVPEEGAVMLAHIRDWATDREAGRWQLRLQMPGQHSPVDLSDQVVKPEKPARKPTAVKFEEKSDKRSVRQSDDIVFINAKPHKKMLSPTDRTVPIDAAAEADVILSDLGAVTRAWVTVRPSGGALVIRLTGQVIGTSALPDDLKPFGNEAKVTAATILKQDGTITITVELP